MYPTRFLSVMVVRLACHVPRDSSLVADPHQVPQGLLEASQVAASRGADTLSVVLVDVLFKTFG